MIAQPASQPEGNDVNARFDDVNRRIDDLQGDIRELRSLVIDAIKRSGEPAD